jgi:hypothetical protein
MRQVGDHGLLTNSTNKLTNLEQIVFVEGSACPPYTNNRLLSIVINGVINNLETFEYISGDLLIKVVISWGEFLATQDVGFEVLMARKVSL